MVIYPRNKQRKAGNLRKGQGSKGEDQAMRFRDQREERMTKHKRKRAVRRGQVTEAIEKRG